MARPQHSNRLQLQAFLLLFLLAGHEAARITEQGRLANALQVAAGQGSTQEAWPDWVPWWIKGRANYNQSEYEDQFQQENKACTWRVTSCGSNCEYRYLPLDGTASESCRLKDDYMMQPERRDHFVELQAGLLWSKAVKFKQNKCGEGYSLKCARRSRHMLKALEFLSKATKDGVSSEKKEREKQLIEHAMTEFEEAYGYQGLMVRELRRKLAAGNGTLVKKSPKAAVLRSLALVTALAQGNSEERAKASETIRSMPEDPTDEDEIPIPKEFEDAITSGEREAQETAEAAQEVSGNTSSLPTTSTEDSMEEMLDRVRTVSQNSEIQESLQHDLEKMEQFDHKETAPLSSLLEMVESLEAPTWRQKRYSEVFKELRKEGMSREDAKKKALKVVNYEEAHGFRPLTTISYILLAGIMIFVGMFAIVEIIAYLTWFVVASLLGCGLISGIWNVAVATKAYNATNSTSFRGKMTVGDWLTCSAKAIWFFVTVPYYLLKFVLLTLKTIIFLPYRMVKWVVKKVKGKNKGVTNSTNQTSALEIEEGGLAETKEQVKENIKSLFQMAAARASKGGFTEVRQLFPEA
mmetsp:Transcript_104454/g.248512  ORF Transcript_104454/g.248512 Transcript_104454/m.248512 type:complete len:579 (-) Transcript_104454:55-1791(-)|eukprot:CAMPEP_0181473244 /NCGR_PEP_ID=MMETSP1110-20121109/40022_1 /TAXON_ID=174948 /ORGANISM="Symbiodinium sp., Strain CCMP421" /LENGTH=578 /DNA_ID=CAMNT_0023598351 /DNA_START=79 /DNA_END=1815 /DNA_ORIENTATION=-